MGAALMLCYYRCRHLCCCAWVRAAARCYDVSRLLSWDLHNRLQRSLALYSKRQVHGTKPTSRLLAFTLRTPRCWHITHSIASSVDSLASVDLALRGSITYHYMRRLLASCLPSWKEVTTINAPTKTAATPISCMNICLYIKSKRHSIKWWF